MLSGGFFKRIVAAGRHQRKQLEAPAEEMKKVTRRNVDWLAGITVKSDNTGNR